MNFVYIISGPLGVGKTSVAKKLAQRISSSIVIHGDEFFLKTENTTLSWEERLDDAWQKILDLTTQYLTRGLNVVIDFVVEGELEWFLSQLPKDKISVKYIVLTTNKQTIVKRLQLRNEERYKGRSFVLLDILTADRKNTKYLFDTTDKSVDEIVHEIIRSSKYLV